MVPWDQMGLNSGMIFVSCSGSMGKDGLTSATDTDIGSEGELLQSKLWGEKSFQ